MTIKHTIWMTSGASRERARTSASTTISVIVQLSDDLNPAFQHGQNGRRGEIYNQQERKEEVKKRKE
jgi:hypothetical protein